MMITSTPQCASPNKNLRKSVLLRTVHSPSIRKRLSNITNQTPVVADASINDDLERSHRRSEADIQKRVSNLSAQSLSPQNINEKEAQDHLQICIKMFTENKINAKNAWNLNIIDYMRSILRSQGHAKDTLQVASTSLDVSTKIYGIRVDDVHSDGLKLASNMARADARKESEAADENENELEEGAQDDKGGKKTKRKRKMTGQKATIAKDVNSLLGDVKKLESVFFQNGANLESSAVENLISNRIPINHGCYKYMLLSKENAWSCYEKLDPVLKEAKSYEHSLSEVKLNICPAFSQIHIDEWDPDKESELLNEDKPTLTEELACDAQGVPIAELDGSVHDIFANADAENQYSSEEEEVNGIGEMALKPVTVTHVVDFNPEENNLYPNDYSYTNSVNLIGNKRITQVWAGPSHWKLKHIRRITSRFSGQQERHQAAKPKKARIQPMPIDFTLDIPGFDKRKLVKMKRYKIDEDPCKITLPQLQLKENNNLHRPLLSKPVCISTNSKSAAENAIDDEVQPYKYENPNDSQYCSQNNMLDDDDNHEPADDGMDFQTQDEDMVAQHGNFAENLIEAPEMVPKSCVPYAMHAKKMDMKKLKGAVWKSLVSERPGEQISDENMFQKKALTTMFSTVYQQLPIRLPENMKKELSCPLAFVALLHLCNEQNLALNGQADLKDFQIKQA